MNSKCLSCSSQLNEKGLCPNCDYYPECDSDWISMDFVPIDVIRVFGIFE